MSECRFFIPGPTWVRPELLQEMTRPMIGHRGAEFRDLFLRITTNLKPLFNTTQDTLVATCTGTALLEASLVNSVQRRALVTTCGAFSERWHSIAQSLGLPVDQLDAGWGKAIDPDELRTHLRSRRGLYDLVTLTHNETSTGLTNDIATLSGVIREEAPEALILVDAVSALAGIPMLFDEWGIDICVASVQKGLALPPGITVFALSANALTRAKTITNRGTYLDFLSYKKHADDGSVPTTPAVSLFYALATQLERIVKEETLNARYQRHVAMRDLTIKRTANYARLASDPSHASPTVSALIPRKPAEEIKSEMKKRGFTLGGGYGLWKQSTFRIGHMGDMSLHDVSSMLDTLEEVAGS